MNNKEIKQAIKDQNEADGTWIYCKQYTNRWGKLMVASDYGYQFWRFKSKSRKKG
ncbi:MAG TPA: hypothetical protein GX523_19060 [Desulfitobacterium dehalogenans]|uniref:Uncharacterized protein n=1 Tax=Desulfitobacterium dehalogenans TaxID=36854 RepID=A0A7C6Z728_9FIRM|nr:hypothetical protein [Desulfitobacterium dehalogenans]